MASMEMPREECRSDGERFLYDYFQEHFSDDFTIWSNIFLMHTSPTTSQTRECEIDFIIHHKEIGLLILEVKDWRIDHIESISANDILMRSGKRSTNPTRSLRNRLYMLKEKCQSRSVLCEEPHRLKFPINTAICFPFISETEWNEKLDELFSNPDDIGMPPSTILFQNHFEDNSPLATSHRAANKLGNIRKIKFPCSLIDADLEFLSIMFGAPDDEVSLATDMAQQEDVPLGSEDTLIRFDTQQASVASEYLSKVFSNPGHLIIEGIAGSGKTLLLQHIFSQLARIPDISIAYIGRQNELIDEFRYNLLCRSIDLENSRFFIGTDYDLFRRVFGEDTWRELPRDWNEKSDAINQIVSRSHSDIPQVFDFMLIDEGHNFPDHQIAMCVCSTKKQENGNVIYMEDPEQNIWDTDRIYNRTKLNPTNRLQLNINYRNTLEISKFALQLSDKYTLTIMEPHRLAELRHGPLPSIAYNEDSQICANLIYSKFKDWLDDGFLPGEIAVIYPMSEKDESGNIDNEGLLLNILRYFGDNGIYFSHRYWKKRLAATFGDYAQYIVTKPSPNSTEEYNQVRQTCVNLVTAFSSQGMTYQCAIVVMDKFGVKRWSEKVENNLLYITLTRATSDLMLTFHEDTDLHKRVASILGGMS